MSSNLYSKINNLLRTIFNSHILRITYKKIEENLTPGLGYIDIEAVAKRYEKSDNKITASDIISTPAIRDSLYFIEKGCGDYTKDFKKVKNVLDIGCGSGIYSRIFRKRQLFSKNFKYVGTEIIQRFVDICKKKNPKENFVVSYADALNFKNNTFDLVYCSSTLHYTLDQWKKSLDEISRIASKYVIIVRFPLTKYYETFYTHQTVLGINNIENHNFIVINRDKFEKYLKKIGFTILRRDYSSEEYIIQGVDERIILCQYLLQK